ncbi:MAG: cytochrome c peroxidase [Candidatus Latescibacterota bacterium]|jgi:cytochrome c peroxidase
MNRYRFANGMRMLNKNIISLLSFVVLCTAVSAQEDLRERYGLRPLPPIPYPQNNQFNPERIELGRLLFFDPILSGEKDTGCGTCHLPKFGMADGRQLGAGTSGKGFGPDRVLGFSAITGDTVIAEARHTMTIFNTAYNKDESGMPSTKGLMLWDGKDRGLEAQALRAIIIRVEMRGDAYPREMAVDSVLTRLRNIPEYVDLFNRAFPAEADSVTQQIPRHGCAWDPTPLQSVITRSTLGRALAAFEREQVTNNSPYDHYVAGAEDALSEEQKRGLGVFFEKGNCATCHSGPEFSEGRFRVQGVEQVGPGQGLASTNTGTPRPSGADRGRFVTSGNLVDLFAFRTVSLRQIAKTAPYMHDGVLETLEDVIEFYDRGGGDEATIDVERLDEEIVPLDLTDGEKADLLAFLHALTDQTIEVKVPPRVPSGLEPAGIELVESEAGLAADYAVFLAPLQSALKMASYPNPFNAETIVQFELPQAGEVELTVYNVLGQRMRRLVTAFLPAGAHRAHWDGRDDAGHEAASGVYLVAASAPGLRGTQRVLLLR